jgi:hypothetical protein
MVGKGQITSERTRKTIIGCGHPREHPKITSDHVTSRGSPMGDN